MEFEETEQKAVSWKVFLGWGMEVNRAKIKETGLDFVISKPFDFNEILNRITETLESKEKVFQEQRGKWS